MDGIRNDLIVGDDYSETDDPAYANAIYLTYLDSYHDLFLSHLPISFSKKSYSYFV